MRNFLLSLVWAVVALTAPSFAADIPSGKPAPAPIPAAPVSWTGLYFGVAGGYAFELRADDESGGV